MNAESVVRSLSLTAAASILAATACRSNGKSQAEVATPKAEVNGAEVVVDFSQSIEGSGELASIVTGVRNAWRGRARASNGCSRVDVEMVEGPAAYAVGDYIISDSTYMITVRPQSRTLAVALRRVPAGVSAATQRFAHSVEIVDATASIVDSAEQIDGSATSHYRVVARYRNALDPAVVGGVDLGERANSTSELHLDYWFASMDGAPALPVLVDPSAGRSVAYNPLRELLARIPGVQMSFEELERRSSVAAAFPRGVLVQTVQSSRTVVAGGVGEVATNARTTMRDRRDATIRLELFRIPNGYSVTSQQVGLASASADSVVRVWNSEASLAWCASGKRAAPTHAPRH